ncbi:DNA repair exonuclease [Candidatus Micrarchaeota archaeon]|nr:DNA repair exonuclease [Candidatus Micrarchaeota archaeon]
MKLAIISDTHFGYARFEEDSYIQAENAFLDADKKADLIIYAGDVFDTKTPKLETLNRAVEILKKVKKPIFAIHGNHERRSKGMVNPAQLLATMGAFRYLHGEAAEFDNLGEKVQIFGLGNVPEELASIALKKALENFKPNPNALKILVLHQSIKELIPNAENEISLEELETLPFDLIINGHIHGKLTKLGGRFIIPGSTVVTQLKKDETAPRGYVLYDTKAKTHEFVEITCRKFFYEELEFKDAGIEEIKKIVEEKIKELKKLDNSAIIRIKIKGTAREGLTSSDITFVNRDDVYLDNHLNATTLKDKLERIKRIKDQKISVKELAIKELEEKIKDKIKLFSPRDLFDKLVIGTDETLEYLKSENK